MKINSLTSTFDYMTWKSKGNIYSQDNICSKYINFKQYKFWMLSRNIFFVLLINLWPCCFNINRGDLLCIGIHLPCLATFKQRGQEKDNSFSKTNSLTLFFWLCGLKIKREYLLSRGNHCTTFGNFPAKWSNDIHGKLVI